MSLGYLGSIKLSTQEGIEIFEAVNNFVDKVFLSETIHKEQNQKQTLQQNQSLLLSNQT